MCGRRFVGGGGARPLGARPIVVSLLCGVADVDVDDDDDVAKGNGERKEDEEREDCKKSLNDVDRSRRLETAAN